MRDRLEVRRSGVVERLAMAFPFRFAAAITRAFRPRNAQPA